MNKYTIVLLFLDALFIFVTVRGSICPPVSMFPYWMIGDFHMQFADGSSANATVGLWYANITLSNGKTGNLTMTKALNKSDHFFIFHDCIHIQGTEPQQRCSLVVPNCNGYTEYLHKAPELVSICPESTSSPDVEAEIIQRIG